MGKAVCCNSEKGKRRVKETEIIKRVGKKKHERPEQELMRVREQMTEKEIMH